MEKPSWWANANCAGTDPRLFYPEFMEDGGSQRQATDLYTDARQVCAGCQVKVECLEWGMTEIHFGLFGGLTPKERRALKRERLQSSVAV